VKEKEIERVESVERCNTGGDVKGRMAEKD